MLISLEISNYRSFKDKVTFYTVQRNFKRFSEHIFKFNENLSILKTSGIYGANGSGKTNLFKGLYMVKKLIENDDYLNSTEALKNFTSFKLDNKLKDKPSRFTIDFISHEKIYSYDISVDTINKRIVHEELAFLKESGDQQIIFKRVFNESGKTKIEFPNNKEILPIVKVISEIIPASSTILSFDLIQDVNVSEARDWFENKIEFLFPTYEFIDISYILFSNPNSLKIANEIIKYTNVGIDKLAIEEVSIELYLGLEGKETIRRFETILTEKPYHSFKDNLGSYCTAIKKTDGTISILKLISYHNDNLGIPIAFEVDQESRGTIVLLHLIPALILSYSKGINYFIDDINTSLHPVMLKEILGQYLTKNLGSAKGQLIFNSHEDFIMDEKIIRQDELWLMEKRDGASDLFPLSDFPNVRFDLNLRKNYLNGKFGAVPFENTPPEFAFS